MFGQVRKKNAPILIEAGRCVSVKYRRVDRANFYVRELDFQLNGPRPESQRLCEPKRSRCSLVRRGETYLSYSPATTSWRGVSVFGRCNYSRH